MTMQTFIKLKLQQWASRKKIELIGSRNLQGEKLYAREFSDNFYMVPCQATLDDFEQGDGDELGNETFPGKMQALHSSSALGVNVFEFWKNIADKTILAKGLGVPSKNITDIRFEQKFPILTDTNKHPNIDIVLEYGNGSICAIECKFTEAYTGRNESHGLKARYLTVTDLWTELPRLYEYAKSISVQDDKNTYLHPAQLIKHTLGLMNKFKDKSKFRLVYLWYNAFGSEGSTHRDELETFAGIIKADGIAFQSITWQELISRMANKHRDLHPAYFDYITERYL